MNRLFALAALFTMVSETANAALYFVDFRTPNAGLFADSITRLEATFTDGTGVANGALNLADGTLRSSSDADGPDTNASWVILGETISVSGVVAPTDLAVRMRVTGSSFGQAGAAVILAYGAVVEGSSFSCSDVNCWPVALVDLVQQNWSSTETTFNTVDEVVQIFLTVTPESPSFSIYASLRTGSQGASAFADFGNTARLSLTLPDGLSFTSASGVFLTQDPDAVPEPTVAVLLGFGLAGLGLSRRRKA